MFLLVTYRVIGPSSLGTLDSTLAVRLDGAHAFALTSAVCTEALREGSPEDTQVDSVELQGMRKASLAWYD